MDRIHMPCPSCGKPNGPGAITCVHCHTLLSKQHTGAQPAGSSQDRQIPVAPVEPVQPPQSAAAPKKGMSNAKILGIILGLGVLVLVGIPMVLGIVSGTVQSANAKGSDVSYISNLTRAQLALELYFDTAGSYPASLASLDPNDMPSGIPLDTGGLLYTLCAPNMYHIATVLSTRPAELDEDADSPPLCATDTIDGNDAFGCSGGTAGYCFDETVVPVPEPSS